MTQGTPCSSQLIHAQGIIERMKERIDELRRVVKFYDLCRAAPEQAKETGAARDAVDWLIETATAIAQDPLFA